jgi:hypothetical protein
MRPVISRLELAVIIATACTGKKPAAPPGSAGMATPSAAALPPGEAFASMTPGAQVAVLAGSAHITPWDTPDENVRVLRVFLRQADSVKR